MRCTNAEVGGYDIRLHLLHIYVKKKAALWLDALNLDWKQCE